MSILLIAGNIAALGYLIYAFFFSDKDVFSWVFFVVICFLAGEVLILEKLFPGEKV